MNMVRDERPCKTKGIRLGDDITQPFSEILPVVIIWENQSALDATNDNMMQGSGGSDMGFAWNATITAYIIGSWKL